MKIGYTEIWDFLDFVDKSGSKWRFRLIAGGVKIDQLKPADLKAIRDDKAYDTELLPSIFTFRDILWQPDVFTNVKMSLPPLRILKADCEEMSKEFDQGSPGQVYANLIKGISLYCQKSIETLESNSRIPVTKVLGDLRKNCFPILMFFIHHPQNRKDYYQDAINRLDYAVKIQLTQFHNRYTELTEPFWEAGFTKQRLKAVEIPEQNGNGNNEEAS